VTEQRDWEPCTAERPLVTQALLRQRGSALPLKYPRCSLTRFEAFADAEEDVSLLRGMWVLWGALFALGALLGTRGVYLGATSLFRCTLTPSQR
jgi:hypothetical protein